MPEDRVVVADPDVMNGMPCFGGTRVPFRNLIDYLEGGHGAGPIECVLALAEEWLPVAVALWWPGDRSWIVASEIDFDSTIVAGSPELRDALLANHSLEAFEVDPDGILSQGGDIINAP